MSARLEHWLRTSVPTYRVALADLTSSTVSANRIAVEIFGQANKEVKLRHIQISKPSLAIAPYRLNKYSVGSTGSTGGSTGQSLPSSVPFRGTDSTYAGVIRFYTNNPSSTAGTLVGTLQEIDIATDDVMNEDFGEAKGTFAVTLQGSTESLAMVIGSTGATVLNGYIEFTVEP